MRASKFKRANFLSPYFLMFVGCIVMGLYVAHFTVDDSFITYRFSKNLALGNGPVFNPGERVEGFSNPLWMLTLAIFYYLPGDLLVYSKILGWLFYLGTGMLLIRNSERLSLNPYFSLLLYIASLPIAIWSMSGMETPLYMFLLLYCVYVLVKSKSGLSTTTYLALFTFLLLARPEAVLHCVIFSLVLLLQRRISLRQIIYAALIVILLVALRFWYYGEILPNTYFAKSYQSISRWHITIVNYLGSYFSFPGLLFALYGLLSIVKYPKGKLYLFWTFIFLQLYFCVKVGGDWMPAWRFIVPVIPLLILISCKTHAYLFSRLGKTHQLILIISITSLFVCLNYLSVKKIIFNPEIIPNIKSLKKTVSNWNPNYEKLASWLNKRQDVKLVAVGELGYFGHYTNFHFLDLHGLIDKTIAKSAEFKNSVIGKKLPYHETGFSETQIGKYILKRSPDLIIISPQEDFHYILDGHYIKVHKIGNFNIYAKTQTSIPSNRISKNCMGLKNSSQATPSFKA